MTRESNIEKYLCTRAKELGGEVRKVRWVGRNGAPDRLVMLPNKSVWVELKATGKEPEAHQVREHNRMKLYGLSVEVVDSFERVDEVLNA